MSGQRGWLWPCTREAAQWMEEGELGRSQTPTSRHGLTPRSQGMGGSCNFLSPKVTVKATVDRKSTRLNSSHPNPSRMPSSA